MTITFWRRLHLACLIVMAAAWTIWSVQLIRSNTSTDSPWFPALIVGNLVLGLARWRRDYLMRGT